jgi:hypothetical protein
LYPIELHGLVLEPSSSLTLFLGKKLDVQKQIKCLILTAGLSNSFLRVFHISAIYGPEGMKTAIMIDQPEVL